MKIETLQIKDLTPDPENARQHDDKNLKAIQGSLKEFGQRKPIVITEDGVIVAGNGTVEAAKRLGWLQIEAVRVPGDWTPEQTKAFALADNRTAELANWDKEVLAAQLIELEEANFEIADFGFLKEQESKEVELDVNSINVKDTFEVVIECKDEFEQQDFLERFMNEGLKVRAIIV
jgi:ParB-like chromosome segregation protein Spo0J